MILKCPSCRRVAPYATDYPTFTPQDLTGCPYCLHTFKMEEGMTDKGREELRERETLRQQFEIVINLAKLQAVRMGESSNCAAYGWSEQERIDAINAVQEHWKRL